MVNFIELIDLFGKDINFKYNNNQKYKNTFGGILTIVYIFISLTIYIYCCYNYIQRKDIKINYQPLKYDKSPPVNLTTLNYSINFNFGLINENSTNSISSFDILFKYFEVYVFNYSDDTILNFTNCSQYTYIRIGGNLLQKCLAAEFKKSDMLNSAGLGIIFHFKNKTRFKEKYMNHNLYIKLFMKDISFSLDNYTNPLQNLPRSYYKLLDYQTLTTSSTILNLNYGITKVTTDYSWFFEYDEQTTENLNLFDIAEEKVFQENIVFYSVFVNLSNEAHSYRRSFQKLSEFLANASSAPNLIFIFFRMLSLTYKNISVDIKALNEIFQYDKTKNRESTIINLEVNICKGKKNLFENMDAASNNSKRIFNNKRVYNLRQSQISLNNNIVLRKAIDNFNQFRVVKNMWCFCCKKNHKMNSEFTLGSSILNYYLNYHNYILKMIEFEYLKYLILSKDQLNLLKFVKLDYLSNKSNPEFMSILKNLKDYSFVCNSHKKDNEIFKSNPYFLQIFDKKSNQSDIDKKILNSIGYIE